MKAEIIQFLRPNGIQKPGTMELPDDCAAGYSAIAQTGCRLTAEVIPAYSSPIAMEGTDNKIDQVSFCIEHPVLGDVSLALVVNQPEETIKALANMVRNFSVQKFNKYKNAHAD